MKKLVTLMMALLLTVTLFGCGGNNNGNNAGSDEPATVTIWHTFTDAQTEYLEKAAKDFNESQDKYTVVCESQPKDGIDDKLYQAVMAGNGPDLYFNYASEAAKYRADGKVVDLSKYLEKDTVNQLPEKVLKEATSFADGGMYILPMVSSGPILFYNKPIFDELGLSAPQTWEELLETAKKIKEAHPDMDGAFAVDSTVDIGNTLIYQTGNDLFDPSTGEVKINTPEVAAQLQMWQDAFKDGLFTNVSGLNDGYCSSAFNAGQIAMFIGSAAGVPYVGPAKGGPEFGFGIVPQGGKAKWTPAWNRGMIVFNYGDEARVNAAVAFTEYFAQPEVNAGWCQACNYPALFPRTMETETYKNFVKNNESFNYLQPEIGGAAPAEGNSIMRTMVKNLMAAVEGGTEVQKAIDDALTYAAEELAAQ